MSDQPTGDSWWEFDPNEKPIPLGAEGWEIADEAELIVNSQRNAIAREDTEPTLQGLTQSRAGSRGHIVTVTLPRFSLPAAAALLIASCVAMFALGWSHGSAVRQTGGGIDRNAHSVLFEREQSAVRHITEEVPSKSFTGGLALTATEGEEVGRT